MKLIIVIALVCSSITNVLGLFNFCSALFYNEHSRSFLLPGARSLAPVDMTSDLARLITDTA